jgi:hypothetical protein
VFINLSPPPAQDILRLFIDRLFASETCFEGLNYPYFLNLLYGPPTVIPKSGSPLEVRIAKDIVRFSPERRELYKGVKITDAGDRAEYMFEPVFTEVIVEEPVYGPPGEDGVAPITGYNRKTELKPTKLDFDEFVADMWMKGVRFGIAADAVRETIEQGKATRMDIALQMEPTDSKDAEVVEESDHLRQDNAPLILPNGKADLRRAKNRFPQVAKNAPLLRKVPRELGQPGYRVTGTVIEPRVPLDIDFEKLAGEGTRIDHTPKGELLVASMDGFLCLDEHTSEIWITSKIENKGGISAKSTGDIRLAVDDYMEHGEVQEGRVVEGKNMTFRADVFGTIISKDGHITLNSNLSGGSAISIGGDVTVKGRAFSATMEAWDGKITAEFAEGCTIIGKSVTIAHAVNCEIIARELQLGKSEGCAIAGKNIRISSSDARKDRETIITVLLPDFSGFDQQISKAKNSMAEIERNLHSKSRAMDIARTDPKLAKIFALGDKIRDGSVKLTEAQQAEWQRVVAQTAPVIRESATLVEKFQALEDEVERLSQARKASGAGESCEIKEVLGETLVRKSNSNLGIAVFRDLPAQELKTRLRHLGAPSERIFSDHKGTLNWKFQVPEHTATPA